MKSIAKFIAKLANFMNYDSSLWSIPCSSYKLATFIKIKVFNSIFLNDWEYFFSYICTRALYEPVTASIALRNTEDKILTTMVVRKGTSTVIVRFAVPLFDWFTTLFINFQKTLDIDTIYHPAVRNSWEKKQHSLTKIIRSCVNYRNYSLYCS